MNKIELRPIKNQDNYFIKEAYKTLRTNLLFSGTDVKVIAVTSCIMHEGKSTVSMALAASLSELGKRVLLIDADLRKSVLASRVEGVIQKGLSAYLSGQAKEEDVIYKTQHENLDVIFSGQFPPNPVELLDSDVMRELLSHMRELYDYVVIDMPPLGMVVDCAVVAPVCDGTVLVLKADEARKHSTREILANLRSKNCVILGAVLNHAEAPKNFRERCAELFHRIYVRFFKKKTKKH